MSTGLLTEKIIGEREYDPCPWMARDAMIQMAVDEIKRMGKAELYEFLERRRDGRGFKG